jgi:hypothetical protein
MTSPSPLDGGTNPLRQWGTRRFRAPPLHCTMHFPRVDLTLGRGHVPGGATRARGCLAGEVGVL